VKLKLNFEGIIKYVFRKTRQNGRMKDVNCNHNDIQMCNRTEILVIS
jgi:hypothetical protein